MSDRIYEVGMISILIVTASLLGFLMYMLVVSIFSDKIEIAKADWKCTKSKTTLQTVLVGKVPVQQPFTSCVEYKRL